MPPESLPASRVREALEIREVSSSSNARPLGLGQPAQIGIEIEVLLDRQVLVQAEALRHVADGRLDLGGLASSCRNRAR